MKRPAPPAPTKMKLKNVSEKKLDGVDFPFIFVGGGAGWASAKTHHKNCSCCEHYSGTCLKIDPLWLTCADRFRHFCLRGG